jgi:hypothetical protein
MNGKYKFGGLEITAVPQWLDVTHEVETESAPFTLARPDGVGALQFSVARYKDGTKPNVQILDLQKLSADFALSRELGKGFGQGVREQPILIYAQSFIAGKQFIRVWYCSNGQDVVLVTYVCERGREGLELSDCEKMVSNLQFDVQAIKGTHQSE